MRVRAHFLPENRRDGQGGVAANIGCQHRSLGVPLQRASLPPRPHPLGTRGEDGEVLRFTTAIGSSVLFFKTALQFLDGNPSCSHVQLARGSAQLHDQRALHRP